MNDETRKLLPALQSGVPVRAIVPSDFDSAYRIAKAVCAAGMAPRGLDTPEKSTVAILHGLEVGLPPMAALQSIAVINGRPTIWGDGALGLVQGSGKLQSIKEWQEGVGDNRVAICRVIRIGDPEPKTRRFSVTDAKLAGLWGKKGKQGEPTPWVTYPERMLQMRARAWALRDGFADVLKGLGITEEIRDIIEHDPLEVPTPPKPPVKSALGVEPPVSSVDRTPPQPPQPPVKVPKDPEPEIIQEPEEQDANVVDADEDGPSPGDLLSRLDDALEKATSADEIEEIWNDHDLESRLESMSQGDEFQGVAQGIKRRHLRRVKTSG